MNTNESRKMNTPETKNDNEACPLDAIVNPPCNEVLLMDCMEGMKQYPDKFFDIAIVDPPYGIGVSKTKRSAKRKGQNYITTYKAKDWDNNIPHEKYWHELFRVSKNQIVWGGNYFKLPLSKGWIFWDKKFSPEFSFAAGELAWSSFNVALKKIEIGYWNTKNNISNNNRMAKAKARIHPTQKPVKLYDWLIMNYAEDCETILDTHVGSGSSRIAAHKAGKSFIGFEIDKDYWEAQEKRFKEFKKQLTLF